VKRSYADPLSLDVKASDNIETVKAKIQGKTGITVDKMRLFFAGQQLKAEGTLLGYNTLADYNIKAQNTIEMMDDREKVKGGAPKATKKLKRDDKKVIVKAKAQNSAAKASQPLVPLLASIADNPNFATEEVNKLGLEKLTELRGEMELCYRADQLVKVLPQYLVEEYANLHKQKEQCENNMAAIETAIEYSFTDAFFTDTSGPSYKSQAFYDHVDNRLETLRKNAAADNERLRMQQELNARFEAEVQARALQLMQQQQPAPAAALEDDDML